MMINAKNVLALTLTLSQMAEITPLSGVTSIDGGDHQVNIWNHEGNLMITIQGTGENITHLKVAA